MVDEDLGEATIVYEGPDGTEERTVPNEHVAYFQDHWIVKTGEDDAGRDTVQRIPGYRVYHVERTVQEFEEEIATVADQLRSFTEEIRRKLPIDTGGRPAGRREESVEIDVEREPGRPEEAEDEADASGPSGS